MKKLVCIRGFLSHKTGHIYTVRKIEEKEYGKAYQLEEDPEYSWICDEIIERDYEPVENIIASVTMKYEDGHEDVRYCTNESQVEKFEKDIKKYMRNYKRRKYQEYSKTIVDYKINYGEVYKAA